MTRVPLIYIAVGVGKMMKENTAPRPRKAAGRQMTWLAAPLGPSAVMSAMDRVRISPEACSNSALECSRRRCKRCRHRSTVTPARSPWRVMSG
jgi:hypothetical protein